MPHLLRSAWISLSLASLSLAVPALAHAADGYVTGNVNLRAGPAPDYPLIALIPGRHRGGRAGLHRRLGMVRRHRL